ncbi:SGNH/GDSL hydrolase family protein [Carnobacterium sp. CS13]|uniref:SGNH/GDSL hydrolase family protein n=1 Tax=Carnobacterium sp. CS13 TaxID=2800128 RepID=UPI001911F5EC|nr:SGNH/GDSL hydrolase family protein [Carnobacterium sp. CS13]QQP71217.1 SGNH/GDSL hydrolase family protein [Carnobacterium sp. CS13]
MAETTEQYKARIAQIKSSIVNEPYIKKMRDDIAEGISKTGNRQADIEDQFKDVIEGTTGKDVISAPEIIAARKGEASLNARLTKNEQETTAQLQQTMTQTEFDSWVATLLDGGPSIFMDSLSELKSTYPNGSSGVALIRETDPARIYVWNGSVWKYFGDYQGIEIKDGTVTSEKYAEKSIDFLRHSEYVPVIHKNRPINLFDYDKVVTGYYIDRTNGTRIKNPDFSVSKIRIDGSQTYSTRKHVHAVFRDGANDYINGTAYSIMDSVQAPPNAKYIEFSTANKDLGEQMFVVGDIPLSFESHYSKLKIAAKDLVKDSTITEDLLSSPLSKKINETYKLQPNQIIAAFFEDNPFCSHTEKFIGDSIAHGAGGTGFATNGELIPGTNVKTNPNGHCWANSYRDLMQNWQTYYNFYRWDSKYTTILSTAYTTPSIANRCFNNTTIENLVEFSFKSDAFKIQYTETPSSGIVEVYLDDELVVEVDSYGASTKPGVTIGFSTTYGEHKVILKATNRRNNLSTNNRFYFEGNNPLHKTVIKNYAQSGINVTTVKNQLPTLVEEDDDLIVIQIGTNDRSRIQLIGFKSTLREVVEYIINLNKKVILVSPPPVPDEKPTYFTTYQLDAAIRQIANEYNVGYISNYDSIMRYCEYTDTPISELFADGLHPNDAGYDVIFRNYVRKLELHYPVDGIVKPSI